MKRIVKIAGLGLPLMLAAAGVFSAPAGAQGPATVPIIIAETAAPIIVSAVKPKPKQTGLDKFEGFVINANSAQITVRAKGNDMAIRTFPLRQSDGLLRARYGTSNQIQRETVEAYLIRGAATCFACLRLPDASTPPLPRNSQHSFANAPLPLRSIRRFR